MQGVRFYKFIHGRFGLVPLLTPQHHNRFVCATSKETNDTVCLTGYRSPRGGVHLLNSATIWQACRATSAATTFIDPIAIGPYGEEFVDGALGVNNPVYMLWTQAQDVWGDAALRGSDQLRGSRLGCVVSIGTGVPALKPVRDDVLGIRNVHGDQQAPEVMNHCTSNISAPGIYGQIGWPKDIGGDGASSVGDATDGYGGYYGRG